MSLYNLNYNAQRSVFLNSDFKKSRFILDIDSKISCYYQMNSILRLSELTITVVFNIFKPSGLLSKHKPCQSSPSCCRFSLSPHQSPALLIVPLSYRKKQISYPFFLSCKLLIIYLSGYKTHLINTVNIIQSPATPTSRNEKERP